MYVCFPHQAEQDFVRDVDAILVIIEHHQDISGKINVKTAQS
jgi:hypothetical protein